MLERLSVAAVLAVLAMVALSGGAAAAFDPDRTEMMLLMLAICGGLMVLVLAFYGLKLGLGIEKQQARDPHAGNDPHH